MERKLPLYFIISGSSRMEKKSLELIHNGFVNIKNYLIKDPYAIETFYISVIQVCSDAWTQQPLTPLSQWRPSLIFPDDTKKLVLGAAFRVLNYRISQDVSLPSKNFPGDFCPLILIMIDTFPTDDWVNAANLLLNRSSPRIASCLMVLLGSDVQASDFLEVPKLQTINFHDANLTCFKNFFVWIDQPA